MREESRIARLEAENAELKSENAKLKLLDDCYLEQLRLGESANIPSRFTTVFPETPTKP
jgi:hypothetical protein